MTILSDAPPRLSFIVPAWNAEAFIGRCISSLQAQTESRIEVLLVDDGSTDATARLCREIAERDARFRLLQQPNQGQGVARNHGLAHARAAYVCFVDSDDWVAPELAALACSHMDRTGADFTSFGISFVNPQGREVRRLSNFRQAELRGPEIFRHALLDEEVYSSPCNKIYRRRLLVEQRLAFPATRGYEDIYFSRALAAVSALASFMPQVLYYALVRPGSTTRRMTASNVEQAVKVLALEQEHFAAAGLMSTSCLQALFLAHCRKFLGHMLVLAALRVDGTDEYRRCVELIDSSGLWMRHAWPPRPDPLPWRVRAAVWLCRYPHLLRRLAALLHRCWPRLV